MILGDFEDGLLMFVVSMIGVNPHHYLEVSIVMGVPPIAGWFISWKIRSVNG